MMAKQSTVQPYPPGSPYGIVEPPGMIPTDQRVMQPFPLTSQTVNPPFAAANVVALQRLTLAAFGKAQLYINQFPCQKVTLLNEGGGDLVYGINGVNLATPTAGNTAGNCFEIANGAAKDIWVSDASALWVASVAGTTVSIEVTGLSGPARPGGPR